MSRLAVAALASVIALAAAACGGASGEPRLTIAAAADLRFAFEEIAAAFEETCACDVALIFGSSGAFATQIKEGLPADVFASADEAYVDELDAAGLLLPDSKRVYAVGRIVLAVPAGSDLEPRSLHDLRDPSVRRIAIANPEHAPYGRAAKEALLSAGLWQEIEPRLVLGENASQATEFVESGNAQAGVLPLSLAIRGEQRLRYALIDESLHRPLRQAAAVLERSEHAELARGFIEFVAGPEGRPVMEKYGFELPGEERS